MLIDKREIERVKRANELVAFIRSRGVSLRQRGKQLVGLCPFHADHEPSLVKILMQNWPPNSHRELTPLREANL